MEIELKQLLCQEITIEPCTGQNGAAEPQYGAAVPYAAKVQGKVKMTRSTKGKDTVSTAQVYLDGLTPVGPDDRITLPDGTQPLIISIATLVDETGATHHKVVYT